MVRDYHATVSGCSLTMPPALVLRGQYDFVTFESCQAWLEVLGNNEQSEYVTLAGCAHYDMLENENLFGSVLGSFLRQNEPPPKPLVFPKPPSRQK